MQNNKSSKKSLASDAISQSFGGSDAGSGEELICKDSSYSYGNSQSSRGSDAGSDEEVEVGYGEVETESKIHLTNSIKTM